MQKGFSLIELVIVVAIIGVIAAIAVPAYNGYVKRTNRTAVQAEMMRISQDLQRYQVANRNSFNGATLETANAKVSFPEGKGHYEFKDGIVDDDGKGWILIAEPQSAQQQGDGVLVLNHRGDKCWIKDSDKTSWSDSSDLAKCESANAKWD